jgi:hypothetical protein
MVGSSRIPFTDRRSCPRYPCVGQAEMLLNGKHYGGGTVTDISRAGCHIQTTRTLPLSTEVQLRLAVAEVGLYIGAKVAFVDPLKGMGMEFRVIPPEQDNKLSRMLEKITGPNVTVGSTAPNLDIFHIPQESAPAMLAEIIKRINENGALTRQELFEIIRANR